MDEDRTNPELVPGLYEALVTERLQDALGELSRDVVPSLHDLDVAEAHDVLTRHVAGVVRRALHGRPLGEQVALCDRLLAAIDGDGGGAAEGEALVPPARELRAVAALLPDGRPDVPARPGAPLSASALYTNGPEEPTVGAELRRELASADRVDLLCAFVLFYGVREMEPSLQTFFLRGGRLRVATLPPRERTLLGMLHFALRGVKSAWPDSTLRSLPCGARRRFVRSSWSCWRSSTTAR